MDLVEIVGLVNLPTWTLSSLSCHSWNIREVKIGYQYRYQYLKQVTHMRRQPVTSLSVVKTTKVVSILLVCTWRHGRHVGGQKQKHFSPLGTKLYFHINSSSNISIVLTPNMAALSRGCKPRIGSLQARLQVFLLKVRWNAVLFKNTAYIFSLNILIDITLLNR